MFVWQSYLVWWWWHDDYQDRVLTHAVVRILMSLWTVVIWSSLFGCSLSAGRSASSESDHLLELQSHICMWRLHVLWPLYQWLSCTEHHVMCWVFAQQQDQWDQQTLANTAHICDRCVHMTPRSWLLDIGSIWGVHSQCKANLSEFVHIDFDRIRSIIFAVLNNGSYQKGTPFEAQTMICCWCLIVVILGVLVPVSMWALMSIPSCTSKTLAPHLCQLLRGHNG